MMRKTILALLLSLLATPALADLYVSEHATLPNGAPAWPALAVHFIGGENGVTPPFLAATRFIRVVAVGGTPTFNYFFIIGPGASAPVAETNTVIVGASGPEYFKVVPGHNLAATLRH